MKHQPVKEEQRKPDGVPYQQFLSYFMQHVPMLGFGGGVAAHLGHSAERGGPHCDRSPAAPATHFVQQLTHFLIIHSASVWLAVL